jgi:tRNA A37 threonylcarbamoyladenosine synthetase subunit TsaC/SUA5/YrdC
MWRVGVARAHPQLRHKAPPSGLVARVVRPPEQHHHHDRNVARRAPLNPLVRSLSGASEALNCCGANTGGRPAAAVRVYVCVLDEEARARRRLVSS